MIFQKRVVKVPGPGKGSRRYRRKLAKCLLQFFQRGSTLQFAVVVHFSPTAPGKGALWLWEGYNSLLHKNLVAIK